jgi:hypothetical protein
VGQWKVEHASPGQMDVHAGNDDGAHPSVALIVVAHRSLIGQKQKKTRSRVTMTSRQGVIEVKAPSW